MPPSGWQSSEYWTWPAARGEASLVQSRWTIPSASPPSTSNSPMWLMSKSPTARRTARCSSTMPVYCTGISQPPKGTIRAPALTWTSRRGVRLSGVVAVASDMDWTRTPPILSPAGHEALPANVGGTEQRALMRIDAGQRDARVHHEGAEHADLVAEPPQRLDHARPDAVLHLKPAPGEPVIPEALAVVERVEARRLDGFLGAHVEESDVQQDLERLLVLAVTAGAAERQ